MFGQQPHLPVDFLLGCVQDLVPGEVQNWVAEHRDRLRVACEDARGRLMAAAGRRKERRDQRARYAPLPVGQLVYLRDHGVRGQHKIQDLWNSMIHQIVRAPAGEGAVYTVALVDDLDRTRNVH